MKMDYRDLSFSDESFNLVVWDPPHLKDINEKSWFAIRYGSLCSETWQKDIKQGYQEIMRVLKPNGIMIMKWSKGKENSKRCISLKEMLEILPDQPIVGHTTGSNSQTNWLCFMKITERIRNGDFTGNPGNLQKTQNPGNGRDVDA